MLYWIIYYIFCNYILYTVYTLDRLVMCKKQNKASDLVFDKFHLINFQEDHLVDSDEIPSTKDLCELKELPNVMKH